MKILAVTSCPLGLVYTHLAKEALEQKAKELGIGIKVETQGPVESDVITKEDILEASGVILTNDMPINNIERFKNLPVIYTSCIEIIRNTEEIINKLK